MGRTPLGESGPRLCQRPLPAGPPIPEAMAMDPRRSLEVRRRMRPTRGGDWPAVLRRDFPASPRRLPADRPPQTARPDPEPAAVPPAPAAPGSHARRAESRCTAKRPTPRDRSASARRTARVGPQRGAPRGWEVHRPRSSAQSRSNPQRPRPRAGFGKAWQSERQGVVRPKPRGYRSGTLPTAHPAGLREPSPPWGRWVPHSSLRNAVGERASRDAIADFHGEELISGTGGTSSGYANRSWWIFVNLTWPVGAGFAAPMLSGERPPPARPLPAPCPPAPPSPESLPWSTTNCSAVTFASWPTCSGR